jgi:transcriptional regulator with XRE-family HTH domain
MPLATTLRLLALARGLNAADIATAIPRAGVETVSAWLRGEKSPGSDQLDALARTFGVPVGALLSELASTFDPARTAGEHELLAAYRALEARQQGALLEVACAMSGTARRRARAGETLLADTPPKPSKRKPVARTPAKPRKPGTRA